MSNYLSEDLQKSLRIQGLITESEVVTKQGDLYVAINVINNTKRVLNLDQSILKEGTKRVLKG
tara:strand:+ start:232 stop:420 length:189 start_codon:yes stop_codon:yes gene_type:complete